MSPQRKTTRRYRESLNKLAKNHPRLKRSLSQAEENRETHLAKYLGGARLSGVEELLRHLELCTKSIKRHHPGIAYLLARAAADFETGTEATLSGYVNVAHEAMRDVMEIEFVLREFLEDPDTLDAWFNATPKELHDRYRPAVLRQRHASRRGQRPEDLPEATDYKAHSRFLHVTPWPTQFALKGLTSARGLFAVDMCFWEMFEHARRLILILHRLFASGRFPGVRNPDPETKLPKFKIGWQRTQEMQQIYLAMMKVFEGESSGTPETERKDA